LRICTASSRRSKDEYPNTTFIFENHIFTKIIKLGPSFQMLFKILPFYELLEQFRNIWWLCRSIVFYLSLSSQMLNLTYIYRRSKSFGTFASAKNSFANTHKENRHLKASIDIIIFLSLFFKKERKALSNFQLFFSRIKLFYQTLFNSDSNQLHKIILINRNQAV